MLLSDPFNRTAIFSAPKPSHHNTGHAAFYSAQKHHLEDMHHPHRGIYSQSVNFRKGAVMKFKTSKLQKEDQKNADNPIVGILMSDDKVLNNSGLDVTIDMTKHRKIVGGGFLQETSK